MTDRFTRWRGELVADLADAEREHERAVGGVALAEQAAATAKAEQREIETGFTRLHPKTSVASALADRRRIAEDQISATVGRVALARGLAENARRRLADIRQALAQLDAIAPASMPAAEEPAAEEIAA